MTPLSLTQAVREAIDAVGHTAPDSAAKIGRIQEIVAQLMRLPGWRDAHVRDLAGRIGGWLLTVNSLDVRFQRARILALLQGVRGLALDIEADLETRIPPKPLGHNVVLLPRRNAA